MTDTAINGVLTLGVGNLVVLLLAISVRQQRRQKGTVPTFASAATVLAGNAVVQVLAITIASSFIPDPPLLLTYAVAFAILPTLWCGLLVTDWLTYSREQRAHDERPAGDETLDMEVARRYVVWGEYENARRAYLAYARAHPKTAEPLFGLEGMYMALERYQDAANTCQLTMDSFQHDIVVWTKAANRLVSLLEDQLRRPQDAADLRATIARRNPSQAPSNEKVSANMPLDESGMREHIEKARTLAHSGSTDSAIAILKSLQQSNPRDPRPYFELAILFEADLQTEAARRTLETLVRDFAGNPGVWSEASFKLADLYLNRYGNDHAARELLEKVADKSPLPEDRSAAQARLDKLNNPWS